MAQKKTIVKLKSVPGIKDGKSVEKGFEIAQANQLLSIKNSAWTLSDPGFVWNGMELAKKTEKSKD